jgi:hypothetical protein
MKTVLPRQLRSIGLVIVVDQIPRLLGVHIIEEAGFFRDVLAIFHHLPQTSSPRWCWRWRYWC